MLVFHQPSTHPLKTVASTTARIAAFFYVGSITASPRRWLAYGLQLCKENKDVVLDVLETAV